MATRFDAPLGSILRIPFGTYDSNGASVTMTGFTVEDVRIYKDGALEERGPDAGYTVFTDFDGLTGIHVLEVDTNEDDSPLGFWTVGSEFMIIITSVTVNSQTVRYPAAWFRLVAAENTAGYPLADVAKINNVATTSVTTINANVGSTQPINFTGTGATAYVKTDMIDIAGAAVSTSSAQIGVNVIQAAGTAWASGSLTSGVFASGAITAAAIAADAIGASELAADAVTEIVAGVWGADATTYQTQGTFGQAIGDPVADTNTIYKAVVTDATGVTVGTDTATMLASGNPVSSGGITTASFAAGAIDAAAIAADAIGSSELAASAVTEIASGVWQDATAGDFTVASSIGKALYIANIAPGASGGHFIAGSNAATTVNITGNITGNLSGSVGSVTGAVGSVTGNVGGNVTGSIGSLATQAKADVNAEVVDTLATDTYAEPGQGTPSATTTLSAKINYLYKAWRNKVTQTSTTYSLYADDTTTVDQKATVSDDSTTFTKGEIATGP